MKKIVLLIILVVALIFVGKYVYDNRSENVVSLGGENNAAQVRGVSVTGSEKMSLYQGFVNGVDALLYSTPITLTNNNDKGRSISFVNMPILFKKDQNGNYNVATSNVRVSGYIGDPGATSTRYSLNGPIYLAPNTTKQFTIHATFSGMASSTYKAALGATSSSGYRIIGDTRLHPLPATQSYSAIFNSGYLTVIKNAAQLTVLYGGAAGSANGLQSSFRVSVTPIGTGVMASTTRANIELINTATGVIATTSIITAQVAGNPAIIPINTSYDMEFTKVFYAYAGLPPAGITYKAVLKSISWTDLSGVRRTQIMDPNTYTTNVTTY